MSFLKPTAASMNRTASNDGHSRSASTTPTVSPSVAKPLAKQLFRDPPQPSTHQHQPISDYSHIGSRVDTGLHSRVQTSLSARRPGHQTPAQAAAARSHSLKEFTSKCDSVIQRAQQLLERTRDQEKLVARALQERLSQSPARRAHSQTTDAISGSPHTARPSLASPRAPPPTPTAASKEPDDAPPQQQHQPEAGGRRSLLAWFSGGSSNTSSGQDSQAAGAAAAVSPVRVSGHVTQCPPPTPVSPAPGIPEASGSPSLFQRVRTSLRRLSGQLPPVPPTSTAPTSLAASPSHPRKSVRFVSPDKLECVTPTKMRLSATATDVLSCEREELEVEDAPATSKTRHEQPSASTTPRGSVVLPPAPPPSAAKSPRQLKERASAGRSSSPSSPSLSPARATVTSSRSRSHSPVSLKASTPARGGSSAAAMPPITPRSKTAEAEAAKEEEGAQVAVAAPATPSRARTTSKSPSRSPSKSINKSPSKASKKAPSASPKKTPAKVPSTRQSLAKDASVTKKLTPAKSTPTPPVPASPSASKAAAEHPKNKRKSKAEKMKEREAKKQAASPIKVATSPSPRKASPQKQQQGTQKNIAAVAAKTREHSQQHRAMLEFVKGNSLKKCMTAFSKKELIVFLHAEGIKVDLEESSKKTLLTDIFALVGKTQKK